MSHLSPAELVDYAEGTADAARASHVETCARCRGAAGALRATLALASEEPRDIPEPSPLFWDHLSARVREQIAAEPAPTVSPWWTPLVRVVAPVTALTIVIITITMTSVKKEDARPAPPQAAISPVAAEADRSVASDQPWVDPSTADVWEVLTAAAADIEWDAHDGAMTVGPGAVDRAVTQLDASELNELGRLLQRELKRSSD